MSVHLLPARRSPTSKVHSNSTDSRLGLETTSYVGSGLTSVWFVLLKHESSVLVLAKSVTGSLLRRNVSPTPRRPLSACSLGISGEERMRAAHPSTALKSVSENVAARQKQSTSQKCYCLCVLARCRMYSLIFKTNITFSRAAHFTNLVQLRCLVSRNKLLHLPPIDRRQRSASDQVVLTSSCIMLSTLSLPCSPKRPLDP